jgi:hypothetical protein
MSWSLSVLAMSELRVVASHVDEVKEEFQLAVDESSCSSKTTPVVLTFFFMCEDSVIGAGEITVRGRSGCCGVVRGRR